MAELRVVPSQSGSNEHLNPKFFLRASPSSYILQLLATYLRTTFKSTVSINTSTFTMPPPKKSAADKRRERFNEKQASLPESQRLANRTDLELESTKALAFSTKYHHRASKIWFQEFIREHKPDFYDPHYFEITGPLVYGPATFKAYCVYLAQSRTGKINGKLAIQTILSILGKLWTQIQRSRRCQFPAYEKDDVKDFIRNDLKSQEGLTSAMLTKPIAFTNDTSHVFSVLYSPDYLATFSEMRIVFNITLYINLMIDAANRGGDMLHNPGMLEKYFLSYTLF
jgi:hypothetical protein